MDFKALIDLANSFAALGVTGILSILFLLWLTGKLHTNNEKDDWAKDAQYREVLRLEAVEARKQSDATLKDLAVAMRENNDLTRRSLDLNEKLVEDYIRRRTPRRGTDNE